LILRILIALYLILFSAFQFDEVYAQTPLERSNYDKLSGYTEMMKYLEKLDSKSKILSISSLGESVEGRDIPALYFSLDKTFGSKRDSKMTVLIYCQQHGNEPSGKEAALIIAREIANNSKSILKNLDLILVPQVNPDGSEAGQRRNANDMDLNRNHAILSEPESYALHNLFLKWMPEVTLDVHEYNAIKEEWISKGFTKDADEMLDGVTNLNIESSIIEFSRSVLIPEVGKYVERDGFIFHRFIVGAPFEDRRIRHSTTAINDGRQSMGIYNTLSFIMEGKRYGDLLTNIEKRTKGQVSALMAFLKTVSKHHKEIRKIVNSSRRRLLEVSDEEDAFIGIQMDYFRNPEQKTLAFPVFDLYSWQHTEMELENYEPIVKIIKSVEKPHAYLFGRKEQRLIDLLSRHQIEMYILKDESEIEVETYSISHVTPTVVEDKSADRVGVRVQTKTLKIERGSVVVFLKQKAANLIPLLLEPQSSWGIVSERSGRKYRFAEYLQEGKQYPIFRLMKSVALQVELYKTE